MRSALLVFLALVTGAWADDIAGASAYSTQHGGRALIVWQNGRTVLERYTNGGSAAQPANIYSITKSLCALGVYHALALGWMRLDDQVAPAFSEWGGNALKKKITVRELLNQTSGLAPGYEIYHARDKNRAAVNQPCVASPGTMFAYGPSHYETLESYMEKKLTRGPLAPENFVKSAIFRPLNIKITGWQTDAKDHPYFSAGIRLTAPDLLKVGQMLQRRGWYWIVPLVPTSYLDEAAKGSPANRMYGMGFWTNQNATKTGAVERDVEEAIGQPISAMAWTTSCLSRKAPNDLIAMVGSYGQRVYISPSRKLVIVRLGNGISFRDPEFLNAFFR